MKTVFLRVIEADDKATALLEAIQEPEKAKGWGWFEVEPGSFESVPRSPFAYWVSDSVLALFGSMRPFGTDDRCARVGLQTGDDFRFVRLWWAVPGSATRSRWFPLAKGGKFSPFYSDIHLVVNWWSNGVEISNFFKGDSGRLASRPQNVEWYFRGGLTWPLRTHRFCPQVLPAGTVISVRGSGIFTPEPNLFLAILSSSMVDVFMHILSGKDAHPQFDIGDVPSIPVPNGDEADRNALSRLSATSVEFRRSLYTRLETSHAFALPALLQVTGVDLTARSAAWSEHVDSVEAELAAIQADIDERCFALYGIDEANRRAITEGFGARPDESSDGDGDGAAEADDETDDTDDSEAAADATGLAAELASWAVGVAFGRFDVRLATGERPMPAEPEPFDPLPACSPGMLTGDDGLPLARPPAGYPLNFPESGVLVDDPGHALDLTAAVRAVFDVVFGADADRWWHDVAALLDPKGNDLRNWLAGGFFEHHIKRHSKSRRKAPILWQLATPSGHYAVWLYAHRLTRDSFFQVQNDWVGPKLAHEERKLANLISAAGGAPTASQRKDIADQGAFVDELKGMLDEVKRIAPLWNPNLDDGVIITMAPLWRLVPQHRAWQKECKSCWDKVTAGEYDWAHLAMHLWPERVVPKCAEDRSLAIAHGLEEEFWVRSLEVRSSKLEPELRTSNSERWEKRKVDSATVAQLIAERTSPAVKDALMSLLEAPAPVAGRGKARKGTKSGALNFEPRTSNPELLGGNE